MITVVITDDDPFVTKSLRTILESTKEVHVLGIGHCAEDALVSYETHRPDVLLTDVRMPKRTGIDVTKGTLAKFPRAILLLLTTSKDEEYIREAFSIGVKEYLIKQNLQATVPSVKPTYNRQAVSGNGIIETFTQMMKNKPTINSHAYTSFGEHEFAIIKEVAVGRSNKEIVDALYLNGDAAHNYISQSLEKPGLRDHTQLVIYFYQCLQ